MINLASSPPGCHQLKTLLPALQTDSAPHSFQQGMLQDELTSPSGNIDCLYNKEAAVFTCPQCEAASSGSDFERLRRAARLEKQQRPDYLGGGNDKFDVVS